MIERHKLTFDILSDPGNKVAARFGIRFKVRENLQEVYRSFDINLSENHGEDSQTLPLPARFIIDSDGKIRDVDANVDYRFRPEPETAVDVVRSLRQAGR
jgi:peroxiredoxin